MDIDGTYKGKATSPFGSADCGLTLAASGTTLTGHVSAMGIESEVKNGTINDNSFAFQAEGTGPLGHMVLDIDGVVEGDRINGTVKAGCMKANFVGTRV